MLKINKGNACYTGGGIYIFYGIQDDRFFIFDNICLGADNKIDIESIGYIDTDNTIDDIDQYVNYVLDNWSDFSNKFNSVNQDHAAELLKAYIHYMKTVKPKGNYLLSEIEEYF